MFTRLILTTALALSLTACLEPQSAPDLPSMTQDDFNIEIMAEDLSHPWAVAELPDGGFLITERGGKAFRIWGDKRLEIEGLPTDIFAEGQGGLLDIVIAPDFLETSEVYFSYSYGTLEANGTALLRATLNENALENPVVIFRASPAKQASAHFGGRITFLPDDTLILTLGDGFAYREDAQKSDTHLGKIVRLTRDGGTPADNPYLGQSNFKPQIYSIGHRNVQGVAYDAQTNTLWAHEHGPRGGDELNIIRPGENYGWPIATKGTDYQGARISPYETFEGMVDPVHDWTPSIAPSGLAIYRGGMFPGWEGDALVGGLASTDLRRVDLEDGKSVGEFDILSDNNERIRDVRISQDGAVLILTDDDENGRLLRITPKTMPNYARYNSYLVQLDQAYYGNNKSRIIELLDTGFSGATEIPQYEYNLYEIVRHLENKDKVLAQEAINNFRLMLEIEKGLVVCEDSESLKDSEGLEIKNRFVYDTMCHEIYISYYGQNGEGFENWLAEKKSILNDLQNQTDKLP